MPPTSSCRRTLPVSDREERRASRPRYDVEIVLSASRSRGPAGVHPISRTLAGRLLDRSIPWPGSASGLLPKATSGTRDAIPTDASTRATTLVARCRRIGGRRPRLWSSLDRATRATESASEDGSHSVVLSRRPRRLLRSVARRGWSARSGAAGSVAPSRSGRPSEAPRRRHYRHERPI